MLASASPRVAVPRARAGARRGALRARASAEPGEASTASAAPPAAATATVPPPAAAPAARPAKPLTETVMVNPVEAKAMAARPVPVSFADAMAFSGVVPEAANGRIAMLGFVAAAAAELNGAGTVLEQASANAGPIAAVAGLLAVASIFPALAGSRAQGMGPFTSDAETVNGRAAMVAFMLLLCLEQEYGAKFFG